MAIQTKRYRVTPIGDRAHVAGHRVKAGDILQLTDREAAAEMPWGTIELADPVDAPPAAAEAEPAPELERPSKGRRKADDAPSKEA